MNSYDSLILEPFNIVCLCLSFALFKLCGTQKFFLYIPLKCNTRKLIISDCSNIIFYIQLFLSKTVNSINIICK